MVMVSSFLVYRAVGDERPAGRSLTGGLLKRVLFLSLYSPSYKPGRAQACPGENSSVPHRRCFYAMDNQITLEDVSPEYQAFVDKFKPKKTTDDCYTPEPIYQAILGWVREHLAGDAEVVRPFWPGGDYTRVSYPEGCVVVDNPPFSIITKIVRDYQAAGIRFFLFAPHLTNFSGDVPGVTHVIAGEAITYENGAEVNTSFLTNMMPGIKAVAEPTLARIVKQANAEVQQATKKALPKYVYPDEVLTVSDMAYMAKYGIRFEVADADCAHVRYLDAQKSKGKTIFGSGYLLAEKAAAEKAAAEKAAAEKAAAEKAAAEKAAAIRWPLSERERQIIRWLGHEAI